MNLNMYGSCIHCQLVSKWNISAFNVRTLFVVTDLFQSMIGAHVRFVHAHRRSIMRYFTLVFAHNVAQIDVHT